MFTLKDKIIKLDISNMDFNQKMDMIKYFLKVGNLKHCLDYGKKPVRIFKGSCGTIAYFMNNARKNGHVLDFNKACSLNFIVLDNYLYKKDPAFQNILKKEKEEKILIKLQKKARKASFSNKVIRKILEADLGKGLYENGVTSGVKNEGKIITIKTLIKHSGERNILEAIKNKENYTTHFDYFCYDARLEFKVDQNNEFYGFLSIYYKGTLNGWEYSLINEDEFYLHDYD